MAVQHAELRFVDEPPGNHGLIRDDDAQIPVLVNHLKRLDDTRDDSNLTCLGEEVDILDEHTIAIEEEGAIALYALFGLSHLWKYAVIR